MDMKPGNLLRKLMAGAAALTIMLQASVIPARADDSPPSSATPRSRG